MGWEVNDDGELVFTPDAPGGEADKAAPTKNIGGRVMQWNAETGRYDIDLGPVDAPTATPTRNLGNGVFQDATGYYTEGNAPMSPAAQAAGRTGGKTYITEAEAERLTSDGPTTSAIAQGNLDARNAEIGLASQRLAADLAEADRQYALALQQQSFLEQKEAFAESQGEKQLALDTRAQLFTQQTTIANLQLQRTQIASQIEQLNAAAQQRASEFNAQMDFNVQQANDASARAKRQDLQQSARDIGELSASPTDFGKLSSYLLANSAFGQQDAGLAQGEDFITDQSLTGLELALRNRNDIAAQPDNPYSFTPISAPVLSSPDLSFLNNVQTSPGLMDTGETVDQTRARIVDEGGKRGQFTGIEGEQRELIPDFVIRKGRALGEFEHGGMAEGAFIAGDSSDGSENEEIVIPMGGQTLILSSKTMYPETFKRIKQRLAKFGKGGMAHYEDGGVFTSGIFEGLGDDRTLARDFQTEAVKRARASSPWPTGVLPTPVYASSPGFNPIVAQLLAALNAQERGLPAEQFQYQRNLLAPQGIGSGVVRRSA